MCWLGVMKLAASFEMPGAARMANGHSPKSVLSKIPGISPVAGEVLIADRAGEMGRWIGSDLSVEAD